MVGSRKGALSVGVGAGGGGGGGSRRRMPPREARVRERQVAPGGGATGVGVTDRLAGVKTGERPGQCKPGSTPVSNTREELSRKPRDPTHTQTLRKIKNSPTCTTGDRCGTVRGVQESGGGAEDDRKRKRH